MASHPRLCFVASLESTAQHCYLLRCLHFTQFYHQPGFLPINKVRRASVLIIALIIFREKQGTIPGCLLQDDLIILLMMKANIA